MSQAQTGHPLVGRTLDGRFQLTGFIGEGAMASVLRAADLKEGGEVAIKVMHPHLAEDRTFAGRFKREAQAAAMLKHPNSVTILGFGTDDRIHYIAMELVNGRDLREVLKADRILSEARAARIVAGICEALAAAHKLGIIHRDLKPENVMVLQDPQVPLREIVKVLDFGIAKLIDNAPKGPQGDIAPDSDPPPALTQVGVVVGTPAYMSPEQCRGLPLDGRSDLYTCGILLYQLTTGRVPFDCDSPFETAGKQAFEQPARPSTHLPTIFPPLEDLIMRALSKDPNERPQSALEFRDALLGLIQTLQGRMGRTMPMMASRAMVAAAEARGAQMRQAAEGGANAPPDATPAPPQLGSAPAGSTGPRGTVMQQGAPQGPSGQGPAQYIPGAQAAPYGFDATVQTANPFQPYPDAQQAQQQQQGQQQGPHEPQAQFQPPFQQGQPQQGQPQQAQVAFQQAPQQSQQQGQQQQQQQQQGQQGQAPQQGQQQGPSALHQSDPGALQQNPAGYPPPPTTREPETSGTGGSGFLSVALVLLAMFLGVGIGFALFKYL